MPAVGELLQAKLTALKPLNDVRNGRFITTWRVLHDFIPLSKQKKSPARKLRTGVMFSKLQFKLPRPKCPLILICSLFATYFTAAPVIMNDFTTILFGWTPTGIIVSREYSLGSSLRGRRFWITVTSPDCESTTSR